MKEREGREKIKQQNQELRFPSGIHMIWDTCQRLEGVAFCILPKIHSCHHWVSCLERSIFSHYWKQCLIN